MLLDGLNPEDFMQSLNVEMNQDRVFKAGEGCG